MADLAKKLSSGSMQPTAKLDSNIAKIVYDGLKDLFVGIKSNGENDNRFFEKFFTVDMVPTIDKNIITDLISNTKSSNDTHIKSTSGDIQKSEDTDRSIQQEKNSIKIGDNDNDNDDGKDEVDTNFTASTPILQDPISQDDITEKIKEHIVWKYPQDIEKPIAILVDHLKTTLQMDPDTPCKVYVGLFMRKSQMIAALPDKQTISRVVVNLKHKDVYALTQPYSGNGKPTIVRDILLEENSMLFLGPSSMCGFNIMVNRYHKFKIPSDTPTGMPGSRMANQERFSIRPRRYERITVIVDYGTSRNMSLQLSDGRSDNLENPGPALQKLVGGIIPSLFSEKNDTGGDNTNGTDIMGSMDETIKKKLAGMPGLDKAARKSRRRQKRKNASSNKNNQYLDIDEQLNAFVKQKESSVNTLLDDELKTHSSEDDEIEAVMNQVRKTT